MEATPPFFAIFGPARGQLFGKKVEKVLKKRWIFVFFGFLYKDLRSRRAADLVRASLPFDGQLELQIQGLHGFVKKLAASAQLHD